MSDDDPRLVPESNLLTKAVNEMDIDKNGITLGLIRVRKDGRVGISWAAEAFYRIPIIDELRKDLIATLHWNADNLESRELDEIVKANQKQIDAATGRAGTPDT